MGVATLLDGVDIDLRAGEVLAIVGPNGAGKSTLLGALAGDRQLASGRVTIGGRDVREARPAELAKLRAVLPQRSTLGVAFTAAEVVRLADHRVSDAVARRHLADVELEHLADRTFPSLSGGEQQRVQLARVLAQLVAHASDGVGAALFLDEPTSALDPKHQQLVLRLARGAASRGHAVAVVLHDLTLAARWADRVALLARGRLVAMGVPEDVLASPQLAEAYGVTFEMLRGAGGPVVTVRD
jgi:iron complex transport system ATP-binding protein